MSHCVLTLTPRWIPESIRWMVLSGKTVKALRILRWVAAFNGKKEEAEKISLEVGAERHCSLGQETGFCSWAVPSSCLCFPSSEARLPSDTKQAPLKAPGLHHPLFLLPASSD